MARSRLRWVSCRSYAAKSAMTSMGRLRAGAHGDRLPPARPFRRADKHAGAGARADFGLLAMMAKAMIASSSCSIGSTRHGIDPAFRPDARALRQRVDSDLLIEASVALAILASAWPLAWFYAGARPDCPGGAPRPGTLR